MNIYRHVFIAQCPENGEAIAYHLTIKSRRRILVERIVEACVDITSGYHEQIADELFTRFGGEQVITAHHHGVDIETWRGK